MMNAVASGTDDVMATAASDVAMAMDPDVVSTVASVVAVATCSDDVVAMGTGRVMTIVSDVAIVILSVDVKVRSTDDVVETGCKNVEAANLNDVITLDPDDVTASDFRSVYDWVCTM